MKKLLVLLLLLTGFVGFSQMGSGQLQEEPVHWSYTVEKTSDTDFTLIFKAEIAPKWHVYSQFTPDGGALPTEITYTGVGEQFELVGKAEESNTETHFNDIFGVDETFFSDEAIIKQKIHLLDATATSIQGNIFYQACIDVCINRDEDFAFSLTGGTAEVTQKEVSAKDAQLSSELVLPLKNTDYLKGEQEDQSFWQVFILGFLGGLIALLTPCVFPMIPLTVSFFTKQNKDARKGKANAFLYGFFIVFIYLLLSLPFHLIDTLDPEILNNISTNAFLNSGFFAIFLFFAFSFFGYYELTLPNSWSSKMDNASNVGGVIGIFFMAVTLAIVSFSCTGPILGSLLAGSLSSDGGAMQLTVGMGGFGLALALPFALFALFPSLLNSLPKSGGWMTTTKVVLGYLELAFAFKFLSNADLVMHWGLLKREIFIGVWVVFFVLLTLYLFGVYRFPHDGPKGKLSKGRLSVGLISGVFSIYLILGLFGANELKVLSGFPPPSTYSIFEKNRESDLTIYKNLDEGMAYAREHDKVVMLDFTGWACVNCRKVEEQVWTDPKVNEILKNDIVIISLYVDDRADLPEAEQFNYEKANGYVKRIETIGDKWATFQAINFKSASQPFYVLMTPEYEILNVPQQYVPTQEYLSWLETGLERAGK